MSVNRSVTTPAAGCRSSALLVGIMEWGTMLDFASRESIAQHAGTRGRRPWPLRLGPAAEMHPASSWDRRALAASSTAAFRQVEMYGRPSGTGRSETPTVPIRAAAAYRTAVVAM